jgi:PhnB protein
MHATAHPCSVIYETYIPPPLLGRFIGHAEFHIGKQVLFLADDYPAMESLGVKSPSALSGTSLNLWVEVGDVEAAQARAVKAGATLLVPVETMVQGEGRRCRIVDPAGHVWTLVER